MNREPIKVLMITSAVIGFFVGPIVMGILLIALFIFGPLETDDPGVFVSWCGVGAVLGAVTGPLAVHLQYGKTGNPTRLRWISSLLSLGYGLPAVLSTIIIAIPLSLFEAGGFLIPCLMGVGWLCCVVDLFRPNTWRRWYRVALIPIVAILNFAPFYEHGAITHALDDSFLKPTISTDGSTLRVTNGNHWAWTNVTVVVDEADKVPASPIPAMPDGYLLQTPRIAPGETFSEPLRAFIGPKGKHFHLRAAKPLRAGLWCVHGQGSDDQKEQGDDEEWQGDIDRRPGSKT